ncbi:hypothetical protein OGAPHI_001474 [Ogataea philodendri]|uniref:Biogenesis of lysosome-related organelles complex 1 subunit CNL1 n=1 Tax=Ogataea philodendri TaxID=1378263 RepID=A0A9P8PBS5_9ASCO|nr:uncharacterized protein OGAPHI_001474 [Ogataea philodendri]KAH3669353.1 hypothetical protein OGAPHI_001474 [Ogataea philodendri]
MDDQSSQTTVHTSASTLRQSSVHTDELTIDDSVQSVSEIEIDDEDDPLKVKELALAFDYLMYKIQDHTSQLSERVENHVIQSKAEHEVDIHAIQQKLEQIKLLLAHCDKVDQEIDKLEQLNIIAKDFNQRLLSVQRRMDAHAKKFK